MTSRVSPLGMILLPQAMLFEACTGTPDSDGVGSTGPEGSGGCGAAGILLFLTIIVLVAVGASLSRRSRPTVRRPATGKSSGAPARDAAAERAGARHAAEQVVSRFQDEALSFYLYSEIVRRGLTPDVEAELRAGRPEVLSLPILEFEALKRDYPSADLDAVLEQILVRLGGGAAEGSGLRAQLKVLVLARAKREAEELVAASER